MRYHQVNTKGRTSDWRCVHQNLKLERAEKSDFTNSGNGLRVINHTGILFGKSFNLGIRNLGQQQTDDLSI